MKSKLISKKSEHQYPRLMKGSGGIIVLFSQPGTGTVVYSSNTLYSIGDHATSWTISSFSDTDDEVLLSNR